MGLFIETNRHLESGIVFFKKEENKKVCVCLDDGQDSGNLLWHLGG